MHSRTGRLRALRWRWVAVGVAAVLAATGLVLSPGPLAAAGRAAQTPLSWGPCPGVPEPALGLECTTVTVPLDYAEPYGETIDIEVSRLPSTQPDRRRGVLLLNIGGQGDSQAALPLRLVSLGLPASVRGALRPGRVRPPRHRPQRAADL